MKMNLPIKMVNRSSSTTNLVDTVYVYSFDMKDTDTIALCWSPRLNRWLRLSIESLVPLQKQPLEE